MFGAETDGLRDQLKCVCPNRVGRMWYECMSEQSIVTRGQTPSFSDFLIGIPTWVESRAEYLPPLVAAQYKVHFPIRSLR